MTTRTELRETEDRLANAREQGQAQFDSIKEMIEELHKATEADGNGAEDQPNVEECEQRIHEDALSVEIRTGWHVPGVRAADSKPAEYRILLCTGGPACQIVGELSEYGEPTTAQMEVQDWFTPWTRIRPQVSPDNYDSEEILHFLNSPNATQMPRKPSLKPLAAR